MSQERTFQLQLKNDQVVVLKFNSIEATGDRLWQMFATTEALDTVEQLIAPVEQTNSARKTLPAKASTATVDGHGDVHEAEPVKTEPTKTVATKKKK
jgi:hypothetical protein